MVRCANCSISLKTHKVIWGLGKLASGEEICSECWRRITDMEADKGPDMKRLTLEDVIYKLSAFKKSAHQKALEAEMLSREEDVLIPPADQERLITDQAPEHPENHTESQDLDSCTCCRKPLTRANKVIWGMGKLKTGELICKDCWQAMIDLDGSVGVRMKEFTPADVRKILGIVPTQNLAPHQEPESNSDIGLPPVEEPVSQTTAIITEPVTSFSQTALESSGITRSSYPALWLVETLEEELERQLTGGEKILAALKGTYGKEHAALIATDQRFILISKKVFGGATTEVYQLGWIRSVERFPSGALSNVAFSLSSNTITVLDVENGPAIFFCDAVRALLNA